MTYRMENKVTVLHHSSRVCITLHVIKKVNVIRGNHFRATKCTYSISAVPIWYYQMRNHNFRLFYATVTILMLRILNIFEYVWRFRSCNSGIEIAYIWNQKNCLNLLSLQHMTWCYNDEVLLHSKYLNTFWSKLRTKIYKYQTASQIISTVACITYFTVAIASFFGET